MIESLYLAWSINAGTRNLYACNAPKNYSSWTHDRSTNSGDPKIGFLKSLENATTTQQIKRSDSSEIAFSERLSHIKTIYGFNLTQFSEILELSRPQLNKWISNSVNPNKTKSISKINILSESSSIFEKKEYGLLGKLLKRYIDGNQTVMDYLLKDDLDKSDIKFIREKLLPDFNSLLSISA